MAHIPSVSTIVLPDSLNGLANDRWSELADKFKLSRSSLQPSEVEKIHFCLAMSDFVTRVCLAQSHNLERIFINPVDLSSRENIDEYIGRQLNDIDDEKLFFRTIRQVRNQLMAQAAAEDLLKSRTIEESLSVVSTLSDSLIIAAYSWAWNQVAKSWGTPTDSEGKPMPLLILGMGKLGGKELNFSSDIDLILTYPEGGTTKGGRKEVDHQQFFVKVAQKMIAALNQVTADGFVFRVDMRLRPFGDSGPLVLSFSALEDYYQEQGRDWERYAMLKARIINAEQRWTPELQQTLKPFIYRRYIDFSVIESLRRMKAMISQETRRRGLVNNIKLGAGGIREVEFIVQALQLIRGGREPALQCQSLLQALISLDEKGVLETQTTVTLRQLYLSLRQTEHYLQEFNDEQTQTLPEDTINQHRLMTLYQCSDWAELLTQISAITRDVNYEFNLIIGEPEDNSAGDTTKELVWWQADADDDSELPDWLSNESGLAFLNGIHDFRKESQRISMGNRGRDMLDKLMPVLLKQCEEKQIDEVCLTAILTVIRQILTRTAYLELLFENQGALGQLINLCQKSLWIGEQIARFPMLLDELIDPQLLYHPTPVEDYDSELQQYLLRIPEEDTEMQLEALRQFKLAHQLKIAAADVSGLLPVMKVSDHLTYLAQTITNRVVHLAWQQMTARYGCPENTTEQDMGFAIIAYGKFGGIELGYGSDLDLVFVHNSDASTLTNGNRQIDARQFYLKLSQRILHIFTTRMTSGILYDVDMRLRPSGNSGLLSVHIETYREYLLDEAWTWEHQAVIRARMVFGHSILFERFNAIRQEIITRQRDENTLRTDVLSMRQKMKDHLEKKEEGMFDLKHSRGGIVDIEFMTQYLVLRHSAEHHQLCDWSDNIRTLEQLSQLTILSPEQVGILQSAYQNFREIQHRLNLRNNEKLAPVERVAEQSKAVVAIWHEVMN